MATWPETTALFATKASGATETGTAWLLMTDFALFTEMRERESEKRGTSVSQSVGEKDAAASEQTAVSHHRQAGRHGRRQVGAAANGQRERERDVHCSRKL